MLSPKEFIEQIQQRILCSDWEFALDGYAGSIDRLQKAFPRYGSFLMEFIQNADDARSSKMKLEIFSKALHISNNGQPFSEKDVISICKVGRSSKTVQDYIGYLGVGFKAVFLISKKPQICSGPWKFTFEQEHWNDSRIPWQIVPLWLENPLIPLESGYSTQFHLPLSGSINISHSEIESLHSRILLFLNNLEQIEIVDHLLQKHRVITKSLVSNQADYQIFQLQDQIQGKALPPERWLLFRGKFTVPDDVHEDHLTIEWERQQVTTREVAVAFKLDSDGNLCKEEKGTAHIGVFSFLPLKEIPSGLSFILQADFLTMTGRGELARECLWNNWLADRLRELIVIKCIPVFSRQEPWKFQFTEIIYAPDGGHELFEKQIKKPLREYFLHAPVLIAEDGSLVKLSQALLVDKKMKPLLDEQTLQQIFPQKKILDVRCIVPAALQDALQNGPDLTNIKSEEKLNELLHLKAREKDLDFFLRFYHFYLIPFLEENPALFSRLKSKLLFLADDFTLADSSLCLNPEQLIIPPTLREIIKIVHPALSADKEILNFFADCRLSSLTQEVINDLLRSKELLYLQQHWNNLSDEEKKAKIFVCKDLWEKGNIFSQHLGFITLPNISGEWLAPDQLTFSEAYNPFYKLHQLHLKGLLDFPINYVDNSFVRDCSEQQKSSWHFFFRQLGVDAKINEKVFKKNIIERIGILLALRYEQHKGRKAQEIPHSQEVFGYDLAPEIDEFHGFVQSSERYIEVKSSEKPNPDICLTTRQFRTLQEQRERYFVYVISDVLRNPALHVTRGDKLLAVTQIRTVIPFHKWWNNAKEDEFKGS